MKHFMALPLLKPNEVLIATEELKNMINGVNEDDFKAKVCSPYYVKICNYSICYL